MKEFIEKAFGIKDSELVGWEYTIPEGYEAIIENGKVIVKKMESEDEKIRKEIVRFIQMEVEDEIVGNKWIAWLEKQGEQKPTDKVKPKFKVGDIIMPKNGGHEPWQIMQVDISDKKYRFKDGCVVHFSQEDDYELVEQNYAWSEDDEIGLGDALWAIKQAGTIAKDENDMGNLWYAEQWLKSLKDRVNPKQEWSEDDEEELDVIIEFLNSPSTAELCPTLRNNAIDWLKSIKDRLRPQWKPSEEQIQALEYQVNSTYKGSWQYKASKELLEQLKKL